MAKERKKIALGFLLSWIAAVIYMTALAFLIPLIVVLLFPPDIFILPPNVGTLAFIAAGLVVLSIIILMLRKKTIGDSLVSLAMLTLIVGAIAAVFVIFGKENIMNMLGFLGALKPAAEGYIEYWELFIPRAWISIAAYFVLAIILWIIGNSRRRTQYQISWMQRMFGKRIKIFK